MCICDCVTHVPMCILHICKCAYVPMCLCAYMCECKGEDVHMWTCANVKMCICAKLNKCLGFPKRAFQFPKKLLVSQTSFSFAKQTFGFQNELLKTSFWFPKQAFGFQNELLVSNTDFRFPKRSFQFSKRAFQLPKHFVRLQNKLSVSKSSFLQWYPHEAFSIPVLMLFDVNINCVCPRCWILPHMVATRYDSIRILEYLFVSYQMLWCIVVSNVIPGDFFIF